MVLDSGSGLKKLSAAPEKAFLFLFLLMSFELEIGKQLHWMEFGLLNFKGGLDDKLMFLDFFQFVALCSAKPSFRIFPRAALWLTQDPILSSYCM